ncbi:helix-turn-helix domain-containing protein [Niveispirillum sp. KHB5.9]|uniref:helix-turn-helix domain-containing protein n=1 Tax=Niveispirillum sp. KHB5.9 TaxID=3400269 RepID=UPI003A849321
MRTLKRAEPNPEIPHDPRERSIWVQGKLRLHNSSFSDIARMLGVSSKAVSQAMYQANHRIEVAVASAIGVAPDALFFERYDAGGMRLHAVRGIKDTTSVTGDHVEAGKAA